MTFIKRIKFLIVLLISMCQRVSCEAESTSSSTGKTVAEVCLELKNELAQVGYLRSDIRNRHDALQCDFLPRKTSSSKPNVLLLKIQNFALKYLEDIMKASDNNENLDTFFYGSSGLVMPELDMLDLIQRIWPNITSIAIMLVAHFVNNKAVGLISGIIGVCYTFYFWSEDGLSGLIVSSVGFMELFNVIKSGHMFNIFIGNGIQIVIVLLIIHLRNTVFSWILLIFIVAIFMVVMVKLFRASDIGANNLVPVVVLLIMNFVKIAFVMKNDLMIRFVPVRLIFGFFNIAFPNGENWSFVANVLVGSRIFASEITDRELSVYVYIFNIILSFIISILMRAFIGSYLIKRSLFDVSWFSLLNGFKLYIVNYDTVKHSIAGWWNGRALSQRRVMFDLIMTICLVHEIAYAFDFFVVRLFLTVIIMAFDSNAVGKSASQLDYVITQDLSLRDKLAAYPQKESAPYFDLGSLQKITPNVMVVLIKRAAGTARGVGTIINDNGTQRLVTVAHVLKGAEAISVITPRGSTVKLKYVDKLITHGSSGDSVVSVELIGTYKEFEGLIVDNITEETKESYSRIISVIPFELTHMINVVHEFLHKQGYLYCCVNLRNGDSGSPLFGLDPDGNISFVGVCSHGKGPSDGNGFATVLSKQEPGTGLSQENVLTGLIPVKPPQSTLSAPVNNDDDQTGLTLVKPPRPTLSAPVSNGNSQIRKESGKKVRYASDESSDLTVSECQSINDLLRNLAHNPPDSPDSDEEHQHKKKRKKDRVKSSRKDAAARKRKMTQAERAKLVARVYKVMEDSGIPMTKTLETCINNGRAIEFNRQRSWSAAYNSNERGDDGAEDEE